MSPNHDNLNDKQLPTRDQFFGWVRDALKSLYDSPYLASHPLVDLLVDQESRTSRRSQDLRRVLVSAIQDMKPVGNSPPDSRDWRSFLILEQRFIAGQTTAEVQQNLNISRSLLYQEQAYALESLVSRLWRTYLQNINSLGTIDAESFPNENQTPDTEILRLMADAAWDVVDIDQLVEELQPMLSMLARQNDIALQYMLDVPVSVPSADRVMLRMLIMGQIGDLVKVSSGGSIHLSTFDTEGQKGLNISRVGALPGYVSGSENLDDLFSKDTYGQLMRAMGGELLIDPDNAINRRLVWPHDAQQQILLLIDDHMEIKDLFARYLSGTNWSIVAAPSGEHARELLKSVIPDVIFLDVILPHEDGWELLQAFRNDPKTSETPIFVCSVILEPQLLETLGASGYLSKPVSRTDLYQILRQVKQLSNTM